MRPGVLRRRRSRPAGSTASCPATTRRVRRRQRHRLPVHLDGPSVARRPRRRGPAARPLARRGATARPRSSPNKRKYLPDAVWLGPTDRRRPRRGLCRLVHLDAVRVLPALPGLLRAGPRQRLLQARHPRPGGPLLGGHGRQRQHRALAAGSRRRRARPRGPQAADVRRQPPGRLPAGRPLQRLRPGRPAAGRSVPRARSDARRADPRESSRSRSPPRSR